MVVGRADLRQRVRKEVQALAVEFDGVFTVETIQQYADECARRFEQAFVTEFVPLLVYRSTRDALRVLAERPSLPADA